MKKFLSLAIASLLTFASTSAASAATATEPTPATTVAAPVAYSEATAATSLQERVNKTGLNEYEYIKAKQAQRLAMVNTTTDTARMAAEVAQQMRGLYVAPRKPTVRPLRTTVPTPSQRRASSQNERQHPTKLAPLPLEDRD